MTDEECEKLIAEFNKTNTPYMDVRLYDGTRIVTQYLKLDGSRGGSGGAYAGFSFNSGGVSGGGDGAEGCLKGLEIEIICGGDNG